jgi:hypothetical protein
MCREGAWNEGPAEKPRSRAQLPESDLADWIRRRRAPSVQARLFGGGAPLPVAPARVPVVVVSSVPCARGCGRMASGGGGLCGSCFAALMQKR